MKHSNHSIEGGAFRSDSRYDVTDNFELTHLVLSQIILHKHQETKGHLHYNVDEVYFFQFGDGMIEIDGTKTMVQAGDIVQVHAGKFHKVINLGQTDLVFHTVYNR